MNISIKIETQVTKEEHEAGVNPESYVVVIKAKDKESFQFIVDEVRSALTEKKL